MKVKHVLGVHNKLPEYPTADDFLYDLELDEATHSNALDETTIVTLKRLKQMYPDEKNYNKAKVHLDTLTEEGMFHKDGEKWNYQPTNNTECNQPN